MKNLKHILLLFVSLMVLASCSGSKPAIIENRQFTTIKETVHDTIFKIEKDSSSYKALLECQNGKIVIKEVAKSEPGRKLKRPRVRIVGNQLKVDCESYAQELLAHYKDTYETNTKSNTITVEVNKLTWFQQLEIYGFRLLMLALLLLGVFLFIKSKK